MRFLAHRARSWALWPAWFSLAGAFLASVEPVSASVGEEVLRALDSARSGASAPPLSRRADLLSVARKRAERLAALPQERRMSHRGEAIGRELERLGVGYRRVALHVDYNRGYPDPAAQFVSSWTGYEPSWKLALDPELDAVGLATVAASDGWIVLVAVLIEERPPALAPDPEALEASTVVAVNRARVDRGLEPLSVRPELVEIARKHSRDMVRRGYFDHRSPTGAEVQDRALLHGLRYSRIGENLHRSVGFDDPTRTAVESWLESRGHRELMLSPQFEQTGIGVAVDDEGTIYFTQMFLTPMP